MFPRLLAVLAVVAVAAPVARPADPPPELKYLPPDAALFLYVDVAAVYDGLVADVVKGMKPEEAALAKEMFKFGLGEGQADVKAMLYAFPKLGELEDMTKWVTVVTFRDKYDRKKVVADLKRQAEQGKGELTEKGDVVRVVRRSPTAPDKKLEIVTDLSDPFRVVMLTGLGDDLLKGSGGRGAHTDFVAKNGGAAVLFGVNGGTLPDVPPEYAALKPFFQADRLGVVGTLTKDKITLTAEVVSKDKASAANVAKAIEAVRTMVADGLAAVRKDSTGGEQELEDLFDAFEAAVKGAKVTTDDRTNTATVTLNRTVKLDAAVRKVQEAAARMRSSNNLKQLALGMHNHESALQYLPQPYTADGKGKKLHSWRVAILPYIDESELYLKFKLDEPWDSEHNLKVFKENPMPKAFAVPGTTNEADKKTHYQVFVGKETAFVPGGKTTIIGISDGSSNTVFVVTAATAVEWTKPDDIEFDPAKDVKEKLLVKFGGIQVSMGDGSVRSLSPKVSEKALKAAVTRDGGEIESLDE